MRVRLVFKVGDLFPTEYFKRNMGCLDGMLVEYYAEGVYWPELSDHMKKVFAIVEVDVADANWPTVRAALAAAVETREAWAAQGKPDYTNWRARSRLVTLSALAAAAGDTKLETQWRDSTVVAPKVLTWATVSGLLKDSATLNAPATDLHAVTTGTYTVGSAATDNYASWAAAAADTGNLTGNLTFTQNSNLSAAAVSTWLNDLGGYTFTLTSAVWHYGNAEAGYTTSIGVNSDLLQFGNEGPGAIEVNRLRINRTIAGSVDLRACIQVVNVDVAWTGYIHHNIFMGSGLRGTGLHINDNTPILYVYANQIKTWSFANCYGLCVVAGNASNIYENNTFYGNTTGVNAANQGGTYRRNAAYADTLDFANHANATGYSNASDDATAANANWKAGSSGNLSARATTDFETVTAALSNYLRPVYDSGLGAATVNSSYVSTNTTDICGDAWATYGNWIGARAGKDMADTGDSAYAVRVATIAVDSLVSNAITIPGHSRVSLEIPGGSSAPILKVGENYLSGIQQHGKSGFSTWTTAASNCIITLPQLGPREETLKIAIAASAATEQNYAVHIRRDPGQLYVAV